MHRRRPRRLRMLRSDLSVRHPFGIVHKDPREDREIPARAVPGLPETIASAARIAVRAADHRRVPDPADRDRHGRQDRTRRETDLPVRTRKGTDHPDHILRGTDHRVPARWETAPTDPVRWVETGPPVPDRRSATEAALPEADRRDRRQEAELPDRVMIVHRPEQLSAKSRRGKSSSKASVAASSIVTNGFRRKSSRLPGRKTR